MSPRTGDRLIACDTSSEPMESDSFVETSPIVELAPLAIDAPRRSSHRGIDRNDDDDNDNNDDDDGDGDTEEDRDYNCDYDYCCDESKIENDANEPCRVKKQRRKRRRSKTQSLPSPWPSSLSSSLPSLQPSPQRHVNPLGLLLLRFIFFASSFSVAESALVVSVSLAARLFGRVGSACVGSMYVSYAFGTLFAGQTIRWLSSSSSSSSSLSPSPSSSSSFFPTSSCHHGDTTLKTCLSWGQACLLPFHLAGLWAIVSAAAAAETVVGNNDGDDVVYDVVIGSIEVNGRTAFLLALCASASGAAAGIAWAAAGAFVTNTALAMSRFAEEAEAPAMAATAPKGGWRRNRLGREHDNDDDDDYGISAPQKNILLRTDFCSLAGNLTGLFNVVLLSTILGGHVWSAYALRMGTTYGTVRSAYGTICAAGFVGVVLMVLLVSDPESGAAVGDDGKVGVKQEIGRMYSAEKEMMVRVEEGFLLPVEGTNGRACVSSSSVWAVVISDVRLTLETPPLESLAWTHLASGFTEGLLLCFVGGTIISDPSHIGTLASIKTVTSAMSAPMFSLLGNDERFGRPNVLVVGAMAYMCATLVVLLVASRAANAPSSSSPDDMVLLSSIYALAGIGFSTWQGTAGGAFLSEIAAAVAKAESIKKTTTTTTKKPTAATNAAVSENNVHRDDSNSVIAAAFSACKALSGTATAIAFFVFSRHGVPYQLVVGTCLAATTLGLFQVLMAKRAGVWSGVKRNCDADGDDDGNDNDDDGRVGFDSKRSVKHGDYGSMRHL